MLYQTLEAAVNGDASVRVPASQRLAELKRAPGYVPALLQVRSLCAAC